MTELPDLIKAVVQNPGEHTPVAMLADHLQEQGDFRGHLLKKWLDGQYGTDWVGDQPIIHHQRLGPTHFGSPLLRTTLGRGYELDRPDGELRDDAGPASPVATLEVRGVDHPYPAPKRYFHVRLTRPEARQLADQMGDRKEQAHQFLDTHFGADPRPEKFALALNEALKSAK